MFALPESANVPLVTASSVFVSHVIRLPVWSLQSRTALGVPASLWWRQMSTKYPAVVIGQMPEEFTDVG